MNDAQFWGLIDATRLGVEEDPDAHIEALTAALAALPESEILQFHRIFSELWSRAYTWDLWAAASIIGGGCSDDGFTDFRGWLVSRGREVYEDALANPESLAEVVDDECQIQGYLEAAGQAWARKMGKDDLDFPEYWTGTSPKEPSGTRWAREDLPRRFPKLWKQFS